ncbi:ATP synthase subunit K, mitochondrial [Psilocybe cubensis]|uniref:ATP synthase subunit K, mitochondrial n=2 Tax=Psilocybe cubensis TaxID=181762 RepID=A0ACB8GPD2_PSICU|nr:ATP synthase subunit K, mitochondrial [Psilocybe cubensis]KAH9477421.1 ATP synthase subunit K, mitochondrial [Psilocybe cubensis]
MSYTILGRSIKNEYLALGTFGITFGSAYLATRGGSKTAQAKPVTVEQAKQTVPINAGSSEEEQFILNFIKEAEKEGAGSASSH